MVFSSLIFIFVFLVLQLVIYIWVEPKYKNHVLLIFSLVFYAWGGVRYLILLVGETWVSWYCGIHIQKSNDARIRKFYMILECVVLLGLLGFFKYTVFFLDNLQALTGFPEAIPNIVLPIGISFYTFQLLSYVVDVYRAQIHAQPKYWKLLLYSSLFHQCIAGPIVRYETVAEEIDHRKVDQNDVYVGIRRFCIGLAKKAILANSCASVAGYSACLRRPGRSVYLRPLAGDDLLHAADLSGFFRIFRYGYRHGTYGRVSLPGKLQLSVYGKVRTGFLEKMAYFIKYLFQRLCIHSPGRKPL